MTRILALYTFTITRKNGDTFEQTLRLTKADADAMNNPQMWDATGGVKSVTVREEAEIASSELRAA